MRTIEMVGGTRRPVVVFTIALLALLAVWGSWPWQQQLVVDEWNEQIEHLSDENVPAAVDRLAGSGEVAIGALVEAIGSDREVVGDAAYRALITTIEEAVVAKGDRGERAGGRGEKLATIARRLAGSVSSYGPTGRHRAAQIAHRLLIRSFDQESRNGLTLISDCETILDIAAGKQVPVGAVGNATGRKTGLGRPDPLINERGPTTVRDALGDAFPVRSAEFLAELPWQADEATLPPIATMGERTATPSSQGGKSDSDATVRPSAQANRLASTDSATAPLVLTPPRRLNTPPDAIRLPRSSRHLPRAEHPASAETAADDEVPSGDRTNARLDRVDLASLSTRELIRSLSGPEREAAPAEVELGNRGFAARQIEVARRLVDPDPTVRRHLVEQIVRLAGIDPRRWLMWLSEDEHADVRLAALTLMATSKDPRLLRRVEQAAARDPDSRIQRLAERLGEGSRGADR